jgi:hypothetical protein
MQTPTRLRRIFGISWLLLTLLSTGWALATPIAAAPDEPAHMIKAASVARGEFVGDPSDKGHVVHVPRYLAQTHDRTCYAFKANVSADCPLPSGDPEEIVPEATTAGLYNPLYYVVVGWPSLFMSGDAAIFAMRIVSGVFSSLFLAAAATLMSAWRRPTLPLIGLLVGATPLFLFISGTVNPTAIEVTATVALFVGMLSVVLHPDRERLAMRCAVVGISGAVALNTRGLAAVWVLLAIVVPLIVLQRQALLDLFRRREVLSAVAAVGVATVLSLAWLFGSSSLFAGLSESGEPSTVPYAGASPYTGLWLIMTGTFDYGQQMVGAFGWLDTPTADIVYFVWAVFTGGAVLAALVILRKSRLVAGLVLSSAFVLMPAFIQAAYITGGGLIWQGRYNLPAFMCMTIGLMALIAHELPSDRPMRLSRRLLVVVVSIWASCQVISFATTVQRYAVGLEGSWVATFVDPDWSAPFGNAGIIALYSALSIGVVIAVAMWHREGSGTTPEETFTAPVPQAPELRDDGVIVAQQPGSR